MLPWLKAVEPAAERIAQMRENSLGKLVRDELLRQLMQGSLVVGTRISEPEIAQRLGVSRVPVREALREIESSGLVESRKSAGVFVRQIGDVECRELYELRGLLDSHCAAILSTVAASQRAIVVTALRASISTMKALAVQGDVQQYYDENLRFHWCIIESAGNRKIADTYQTITQQLHLARIGNLSQDHGMMISIAEHRGIVQAIASGDPGKARAVTAAHVEHAHGRLVKHVPAVPPIKNLIRKLKSI